MHKCIPYDRLHPLPFPGEFVNSLCVGRGHINQGVIAPGNYFILIRCAEHHPADPLQFLTQFLACYRRFFCKTRTFQPFGSDRRSHDSALRSFTQLTGKRKLVRESICLRLDIFASQNRYMALPFDMPPLAARGMDTARVAKAPEANRFGGFVC